MPSLDTDTPDPLPRLSRRRPKFRSVVSPDATMPTAAMVACAGVGLEREVGYRWDGRKRGNRPIVLLQHTLAGCGRVRRRGMVHEVPVGSTMLLNIPDTHVYDVPPGRTWRFFFIVAYGSELVRIWRDAVRVGGPVVRLDDATIRRAGTLAADVLNGDIGDRHALSAAAYTVGMGVAAWAERQRRPALPPPNAASIDRALALAERRHGIGLDIDDLAEAAGLSRWYFSRLFRTAVGTSPGLHLLDLRLREALRLLQTTPRPVKRIAFECGFAGLDSFGKAFRRRFGTSPSHARKPGLLAPTGSDVTA
ncbi:MAG: AraC family transcriptional regulator [Planctomycetota bacterium]